MPLPNMSSTVARFLQPVTLVTVSETIVSGDPVESKVQTSINAVIETPRAEQLTQDQLGNSLKYKSVWTITKQLNVDDQIIHKGVTYRITSPSDWSDYGYYEAVAEEVKES